MKLIRQENHQVRLVIGTVRDGPGMSSCVKQQVLIRILIQRNLQAMQFQQQHQNRIQDHYRHLMVAHGHDSFDSSYDSSAMLKAPPPGLEPESESRHRFGASSLSTWIENMSI